jgi:hypothetical protein
MEARWCFEMGDVYEDAIWRPVDLQRDVRVRFGNLDGQ